ncbi:MAG: FliH/SctL family protein [Devosia sp.]
MTAQPARFTFDLDLGGPPAPSGTLLSDAARAEMLREARAEGHAEGLAAGERTAVAAAAQSLAAAADALADRAAQMLAAIDQSRAQLEADAVQLAAAVGRKLAADLVAREPIVELEALLAECLASLQGAPHLVIRCHPDLADRIRDAATERMAANGFSGRLVVLGEPDIAPGDGRIEWADGGLIRDQAAISADIDRRIAAYLEARRGPNFKETNP